MRTLDGEERRLLDTDIITNGKEPYCIRRCYGRDFSEVTEQTRHVVVEGAIFDPVSIRHTSPFKFKKSSSRFEKGLQLNLSKL